jgi:transcriptional regulator with XRE-family HTH domain
MITHLDLQYAKKFSELIGNAKLLQKQVESMTGLPQRTISKLIGGHDPFTHEIKIAICKGFNISLEEFIIFNGTTQLPENITTTSNTLSAEVTDLRIVNSLLESKELMISALQAAILSKDETIHSKDETIAAQNLVIEGWTTTTRMKDEEITELKRKVQKLKDKLDGK